MSDLDRITFFRSYYEAIEELPDKVQLTVLKAILEYGLNRKEKPLSGVAKSVFTLIKPHLDVSRAKALNGRKGGESKEEAKAKQSESINEAYESKDKDSFSFATIQNKNKNKNKNMNIEEEYNTQLSRLYGLGG